MQAHIFVFSIMFNWVFNYVFKILPTSPETSSVTHGFLRTMLCNFQMFGDFLVIFLLCISTLIAYGEEKML